LVLAPLEIRPPDAKEGLGSDFQDPVDLTDEASSNRLRFAFVTTSYRYCHRRLSPFILSMMGLHRETWVGYPEPSLPQALDH